MDHFTNYYSITLASFWVIGFARFLWSSSWKLPGQNQDPVIYNSTNQHFLSSCKVTNSRRKHWNFFFQTLVAKLSKFQGQPKLFLTSIQIRSNLNKHSVINCDNLALKYILMLFAQSCSRLFKIFWRCAD